MSMFPHTVTLYNVTREVDTGTMQDVTKLYVTVLDGVLLSASKAANVRASGLEGADAVNLYIPFSVVAKDATTGKKKRYAGPQDFWNAEEKTGLWTLSTNGNGGESFFVKGRFVTDNETVAREYDDCYEVTKVDMKDYGDLKHWAVGGK